MSQENDITPQELAQMRRESEMEADRKERQVFAEQASQRGLVYKEDIDCYVDEKGNLLNVYGEPI